MLQNIFLCCMYNVYLYFTFSIINKPFQNTDIWEMHEIRGLEFPLHILHLTYTQDFLLIPDRYGK